jgi:glyoxylase-like metal-dependent hydrolase (beta-lactamase superfamily II)
MQGIYRFQVGAMACMVVHEGMTELSLASFPERYPNATPEQIADAVRILAIEGNITHSHMNCLLIEHDGKRLLVDSGQGAGAQPRLGQLLPYLRGAGISPDQIDQIFITHFHIDHINGLMDSSGEPVFSRATYCALRAEWEYWFSPQTLERIGEERASLLRSQLLPLQDRFQLLEDGQQIAPGIRTQLMPGHSPGHTGLLLESNGQRLLHVVDLLHHPAQLIYPGWHIKFDSDRQQAEATRRSVLAQAADGQWLTMFYHLPFPAIGHVVRVDDAFRWQPLTEA